MTIDHGRTTVIAFVVSLSPAGLVIGLVAAGAMAVGADHLSQHYIGKIYDWFQ
jgi:hypothetical protein